MKIYSNHQIQTEISNQSHIEDLGSVNNLDDVFMDIQSLTITDTKVSIDDINIVNQGIV